MVVADAGGLVRYLNPAAERMTGRSSARALAHPLEDIFHGTPDLSEIARRAMDTNSPVACDGLTLGSLPVDAIAAPLSPREDGVVLTLRDRTIARKVATDLQLSDRLASLATIAAGIAHEVKNPLGGIRGAAQLLARKADDDTREYLEVIVREVDRITSLIDRLRDLAAPDISQSRGPVDLNRLLHELTLLQGATGEATIELDLDPSLPPIDADADALKRLFLNLLRNALEAPATHVHVATRVETGRRWRDPMGRLHALVTATVEDDGPGIPPPDRERLFEPFFTTKAAGTGLGLAAVQRIAHDHSGTIEFEEPASGRGARFVFTIPAVAS